MAYDLAKPSPCLSKIVRSYWTIENCLTNGKEHVQRIVPNGLLELIFYLGDRPVSSGGIGIISEKTMITGHLKEYYDLKVTGNLSLFSIMFNPHGLSLLFDLPVRELPNQLVPLRCISSVNTAELENRLYEASSFVDRILIVERFLLDLLYKQRRKYNFERIEHCLKIINRSKCTVTIDQLAAEACFSRKQFERVFSEYVGATPKQFIKTIRFQHAISYKSRHMSATLTDLTYTCGYYDQAHMINDFKFLTGMTPKKYFESSEPFSDYFQTG